MRLKELKAIYKFIDSADSHELGSIIEEIRCCHDNLLAFNKDTGLLAKVESISLNGGGIQLNIEGNANEDKKEG